jgi:hypothetical protein
MKKNRVLSFLFFLLLGSLIGNAQTTNKSTTISENKIEAFYFHNSARCVTCRTVEAEAKADLENLYGTQVTFKSLNLEEDSTKPIADKLKVSGQTLLVVQGAKQVNLTNEGFLYARTNPVKFKKIIKEKVDKLLGL